MNRMSLILWSSFLVVVVVGVFAIAKFGSTAMDSSASATTAIIDSDWVKGNKSASTTLIEYSDFQCPACGAYYPITKQLIGEFGDSIVFAYRHFPLSQIHKNAELAAHAAEAAGVQGKFWEMHDLLFEHQKEWSNQKNSADLFKSYAETLGLNAEQFTVDIDSDKTKNRVEADYRGGFALGVNATPTFFLNGKKLQNPQNYGEFQALVRKATYK